MGKRKGEFTSPKAEKQRVPSAFVPNVSELGEVFLAKSRRGNSPAVLKDIQISILPYCSDGSVYASSFKQGLVVVQVTHGEKPNCLYMLHQVMERFCESMHMDDSDFPPSFPDLQGHYNFKYILTGKKEKDVDAIGFCPYRVAFYMEADANVVKSHTATTT